jgi:4-diphosphocytidyl-2-C-methyl-D-erythritol kinase
VNGREFAPAKVNLFLHVGRRGADGYHPISSLMVFADVGDVLEAAPADRLSLTVEGPFADDAGETADNLVLKAARGLLGEDAPWALRLDKQTPVGAGLGGGSADAAAAIRLLSRHLPRSEIAKYDLRRLAASLGADVPACATSRPVIAEGRGERLAPGPSMAPIPAVLAWPGLPCATSDVYRAFDAEPGDARADRPRLPASLETPGQVAALIGATRNDLEAPAVALQPAVAEALSVLRAAPEALSARMSGSGSACFAVCRDAAAAHALAARLQVERPQWWVRACRLGGHR